MSTKPVDRRMLYFALLSQTEQVQAIRKLSQSGMSDHGISAATQLSVEQVRRILAEQTPESAA